MVRDCSRHRPASQWPRLNAASHSARPAIQSALRPTPTQSITVLLCAPCLVAGKCCLLVRVAWHSPGKPRPRYCSSRNTRLCKPTWMRSPRARVVVGPIRDEGSVMGNGPFVIRYSSLRTRQPCLSRSRSHKSIWQAVRRPSISTKTRARSPEDRRWSKIASIPFSGPLVTRRRSPRRNGSPR